jgi:hypothetical protein
VKLTDESEVEETGFDVNGAIEDDPILGIDHRNLPELGWYLYFMILADFRFGIYILVYI